MFEPHCLRIGVDVKKEIKKRLDANDKQYDDIAEIIKAIRQMIPYDRMLVSHDGYLIPLEDKYFRDNPQTMGFKHGGYITCVGYITKNHLSNSFDDFRYIIILFVISIKQLFYFFFYIYTAFSLLSTIQFARNTFI